MNKDKTIIYMLDVEAKLVHKLYTLTSKNFGRFYFQTKLCPKIKLSEL